MVGCVRRALRCAAAACLALALMSLPGVAMAQSSGGSGVSLPAVGFQVSDYATAGLTLFGTGLAVLVGIYFAVLIVRLLIRWGKHCMAG
jgi:hypothetical protein